jgi:hypothetical protein
MSTPEIVTTAPEARQIAKVLEFSAFATPHISWDSIARTARELGANFEARFTDQGACTVTMFWAYAAEDVATVAPTSHDPTATDRAEVRDALDAAIQANHRGVALIDARVGGTGWTLEDLVQATDHAGVIDAETGRIATEISVFDLAAWVDLILTNEPARWVEEDV